MAWHEQTHRNTVQMGPADEQGRREISGTDMQRKPGFGAFTFAVGLYPGEENNRDNTVIAEQAGLWSLVTVNEGLNLNIGDRSLDVSVPWEFGCNGIVVTGDFAHSITNWEDNDVAFELRVYVNGTHIPQPQC
jgi:hypothetical protein